MITLTERELEYLQTPAIKSLLQRNDFEKFFKNMDASMRANITAWLVENNIDFLKDMKIINSQQFYATQIKDLIIPSNITAVRRYSFKTDGVETIIFKPNDNIILDQYAFGGAVKDIILPEGLAKVPSSLFYGCTDLRYIFIPESVRLLPKKLFDSCVTDNLVIETNYRKRKIDKLQCKKEDEAFYREHLKFKHEDEDASQGLEVSV